MGQAGPAGAGAAPADGGPGWAGDGRPGPEGRPGYPGAPQNGRGPGAASADGGGAVGVAPAGASTGSDWRTTDPATTRLPAELFTREPRRRSQLPELPPLAGVAGGFVQALVARWRRNPLDVSALVLLILAGLVYPFPIWLIGFLFWAGGAIMVGISRTWARPDKFVGLAVPVIVAVVGTALALAGGGEHATFQPYGHEIATTGPLLLRIAIIAGALYLVWRARRGRRAPAEPPWRRPHRRYWDQS